MVVHDVTRVQAWAEAREVQQTDGETTKRFLPSLSVVAVQSVACGVVVLLVLFLRMAGGDAYAVLQQRFHQALARNEWVSALVLWWDGDPLEKVEDSALKSENESVKADTFTAGESAPLSDFPAAVAVMAPLAEGTLTSGYGERIHPMDGAEEFHTGVDIAAPTGTPLVAVWDGEVTEVGENDRLGRYVRLSHGVGIEIVYGHCDSVLAREGDIVQAGQSVALVGSTGVSTGSHVHIRLSVDGVTCDPTTLLSLERYV